MADEHKNVKLFHQTSESAHDQANSAYLIGAFMVVVLQ